MRYVSLTIDQVDQLTQLYKSSPDHRERQRAHALLLSHRNFSIPDLADLFVVDRDTIGRWMDRWQDWVKQTQPTLNLQDQPRSGRIPNLTNDQKKSVVEWVKQGMHRTRDVAQTIHERWQKTVSLSSLRRFFRASKLSYKRIRRSCRHLRDETAYAFFKTELGALRAWAASGEVDLCYGDEMGLSRQAVVPYGWQEMGKSDAFMPATPSGNLTTLGFFYEDNRLESYVLSGAITSDMMVRCVTDFVSRLTKPTVLILDNASSHTSAFFKSHLAGWRSQGLMIQYIPAYCPEPD